MNFFESDLSAKYYLNSLCEGKQVGILYHFTSLNDKFTTRLLNGRIHSIIKRGLFSTKISGVRYLRQFLFL